MHEMETCVRTTGLKRGVLAIGSDLTVVSRDVARGFLLGRLVRAAPKVFIFGGASLDAFFVHEKNSHKSARSQPMFAVMEFDTQDTVPAYIRMRLPLARGPLDPLSQPYSICRAGPGRLQTLHTVRVCTVPTRANTERQCKRRPP